MRRAVVQAAASFAVGALIGLTLIAVALLVLRNLLEP